MCSDARSTESPLALFVPHPLGGYTRCCAELRVRAYHGAVLDVGREDRVSVMTEGGEVLMLGCRRHGALLDMCGPTIGFLKAKDGRINPWLTNCIVCSNALRSAKRKVKAAKKRAGPATAPN
jgi:hypothetical protein